MEKKTIFSVVTNWMSLEVAHSFIFGTTEINSSMVRSTQTAAQRTFIKLEVGAAKGQLSGHTLRTRGSGLWNSENEGRLERNAINAKQK